MSRPILAIAVLTLCALQTSCASIVSNIIDSATGSRCGASRSGLRSEAPWQRLWAVRTDRVSFRRITRTPRAVLGRERGGVLPRQQRPSVKGGLDFRDLTSEFAA